MNCICGGANETRAGPMKPPFLATYQLLPSFQYIEELGCYIDDRINFPDYIPEPHPPPTKKSEIFDSMRFLDVDKRALQTPTKYLSQSINKLVLYLMKNLTDDLSKIRVIYRWVTAQIVNDMKFPQDPPSDQVSYQLWRIQRQKGNHAQLIALMCRYAGLLCVIVHGRLKGTSYDIGMSTDMDNTYGEWNAVLIDKHWRLVNAFWGSYAEMMTSSETELEKPNGDAHNSYLYDENYFLTDPEQIGYSHLPDNPKWQLRNNPISIQQFESFPLVKDRFFELEMSLLTHTVGIIKANGGHVTMKFGLPRHRSTDLQFQHLLFRLLKSRSTQRYDNYIFMHKSNADELEVRIRSPVAGNFRFELVGRDVTVKPSNSNYDWAVIYKIQFKENAPNCKSFPVCPLIGWGPGCTTREFGLQPVTHTSGEILLNHKGPFEIRFTTTGDEDADQLHFKANLITNDTEEIDLKNHTVHRIEDSEIVFSFDVPKKGEYALILAVKLPSDSVYKNFCNYFITCTKSFSYNGPYPFDVSQKLGAKTGFYQHRMRAVFHNSNYIHCESNEVVLVFEIPIEIAVFGELTGGTMDNIKEKVLKEVDSQTVFRINLPRTGKYGFSLKTDDASAEVLSDYIIDYRKGKSADLSFSSWHTDQMVETIIARIKKAILSQNLVDLKNGVSDMKALDMPSLAPDISKAEREWDFLLTMMELKKATVNRDLLSLEATLQKVFEREYEERIPLEVSEAKYVLQCLQKLQSSLHAIMEMNNKTIAEIRSYQNPPLIVHRVMMATLLILGHEEDVTGYWKNIQSMMWRTGKDSIKQHIQNISIDDVYYSVCVRAKEILADIMIDKVRMVSIGATTFYVWVNGIIEEKESRHNDSGDDEKQ